jgi:CelD/BcsL family acetyltransferase involved in cellulose biosynthesis
MSVGFPGDRPAAGPTAEALSYDEFCRLERPWDELVLASPLPLPFLCHAWIRLWWQHFGAGQDFTAWVVREGDRLLAGVPIAVRGSRAVGLRLTVGEIVGTGPVVTRGMGLSDKADLVVRTDAPAARPRLVESLLGLLRSGVDALDLKGLDESSPAAAAFGELAPRPESLRCLRRSASPYVELPPTWDDYLRSRSANFRKHLKKYRRLLEDRGPVDIVRLERESDAAILMADVGAISDASWKARRGTDLFCAPAIRAFFLDLVPELARHGRIDLQVLRLAGRPAAHELSFDFGGRLFSYNSAYRQDLAPCSPGTVLTAAVIERACARGRVEYDMLRGDEEYKPRWSGQRRYESQLLVPAERARARVRAYVALYLKARLKRWRWVERLGDRAAGLLNRRRFSV